MKPYAITGVGLVSPLGVGFDAWRRALDQHVARGQTAFGSESAVLSEKILDPIAAEARDFDATEHLGKKGLRNFDRLTKFLIVAAKLSLEDAGLKRDGTHTVLGADRVGICSATAYGSLDAITELVSVAELEDPRFLNPNRFPNTVINSAAGYVSIWEDLRAPNVTVVDGNCGSLDAVLACETHLLNGRAEAFLVGGGEVLSDALYLAFRKLDSLADGDRRFAPGHPDSQGTRLGEGAAYLCVEPLAHAEGRGARVRGRVLGYGNAFEPPASEAVLVHASERSMSRAIQQALDDAGLDAGGVDLVCGSLSGLRQFDVPELQAIEAVLGSVPVAAPKALFGETFGASGALGMSAALAWLDGAAAGPLVRGPAPERLETVLVIAVGFYGNVSAVLVGR